MKNSSNFMGAVIFTISFLVFQIADVQADNNSDLNIVGGTYQKLQGKAELESSILAMFNNALNCNGIADPGEEFSIGCIVEQEMPCRKIIRAGKINDVTFIHYEKGGRGVILQLLAVRTKDNKVLSWEFLNPEKIWYSWEITEAVPEKPKCNQYKEFQYPEAMALGLCEVKKNGT